MLGREEWLQTNTFFFFFKGNADYVSMGGEMTRKSSLSYASFHSVSNSTPSSVVSPWLEAGREFLYSHL